MIHEDVSLQYAILLNDLLVKLTLPCARCLLVAANHIKPSGTSLIAVLHGLLCIEPELFRCPKVVAQDVLLPALRNVRH